MPLSLRRPKRDPQPALTLDHSHSRSVSTPTLLSRLRNYTFSRSKASLFSALAYESVRSRTPPTPYSPNKNPQHEPKLTAEATANLKADEWKQRGFVMSKEQRECLAGAEGLGIWNPITGENGMSFPSEQD